MHITLQVKKSSNQSRNNQLSHPKIEVRSQAMEKLIIAVVMVRIERQISMEAYQTVVIRVPSMLMMTWTSQVTQMMRKREGTMSMTYMEMVKKLTLRKFLKRIYSSNSRGQQVAKIVKLSLRLLMNEVEMMIIY